jgi:hypothetical protein
MVASLFWWSRHEPTVTEPNTVECELLRTKHLAVSAMVNGKGPYRLIFDTGSPVVLLSSRIAQEAELHGPAARKANRAAGGMPGQVMVSTLELGDVKAERVPAVVMDHPTIKAIEGVAGRLDGIIGYPFFARFKTTVDYANQKVVFEKSDHQPDDVMQAMMKAMFERPTGKKAPTIAPAGQWGLQVGKPEGDTSPGVVIMTVFPGTAAAAAGLREGDRLLTIDGRWTDSEADCRLAASLAPADQLVEITFARNGQTKSAKIQPRPGF